MTQTLTNQFLGIPVDALPAHFQKLLATIHVYEEAIYYTRHGNNGDARQGYQLSPEDLAAALSGVPIATGVLPKGCLFYARTGGQERIGIYLPPRHHRLTVAAGTHPETFEIPFPGCVFVGEGTNYNIWAVRQRPGWDDRLYACPAPNVNTGGTICAGDAGFPICSATSIHAAADVFFASRFNDHLAGGKSQEHADDVLDLWRALRDAGAEEYPLDDLVPSRYTLKDIVGGAR